MTINIRKSKANAEIKDDFSIAEDTSADMFEFYEGEPILEGNISSSFTFDDEGTLCELPILVEAVEDNSTAQLNSTQLKPKSNQAINTDDQSSDNKNEIFDSRTLRANPNGRTPSIDGEIFDMVRTYTLRSSTIRILSKIKVIHRDDNVYLNTIIDEAIRYYYEYLKNLSIEN